MPSLSTAFLLLEGAPPADVAALFGRALDADRLGPIDFHVRTFARGPRLSAIVADQLQEPEPWDDETFLDAAASALARLTKRAVHRVHVMADVCEYAKAFSKHGVARWEEGPNFSTHFTARGAVKSTREWEGDGLQSHQRKVLPALPKTVAAHAFPLWRVCSELEGAPRPAQLGLARYPDDDNPRWKTVQHFQLKLSAAESARREAVAKAEAHQRAEALLVERARAEEAARRATAAAREAKQLERQRQEAELHDLLDRTLVPGDACELPLPAKLVQAVDTLARKHDVDPAWVLQAGTLRSIPWKFPPGALPAVPLVRPVKRALVMSPALRVALNASTLSRADGSPASREELIRVALSVGLDDLREELKEDARKRGKLARRAR